MLADQDFRFRICVPANKWIPKLDCRLLQRESEHLVEALLVRAEGRRLAPMRIAPPCASAPGFTRTATRAREPGRPAIAPMRRISRSDVDLADPGSARARARPRFSGP
jgi:hypothetical protein